MSTRSVSAHELASRPFGLNLHLSPVQINAAAKNAGGRKILDYASDSSSDVDTPTVSNTWRGQDYDNSDNESIDSQNEDMLKWVEILHKKVSIFS